nr:MAG TPA: hypothetical protein [Caudoviricetes sp.]
MYSLEYSCLDCFAILLTECLSSRFLKFGAKPFFKSCFLKLFQENHRFKTYK